MANLENIFEEKYFANYQISTKKVSYETSDEIKGFLRSVAEHIVKNLHPKSVLDVGCAMGYLVEALRDLGVEAYGVDVSHYAISKVRQDIKPYCYVASGLREFPTDLPQTFDLVVCIEVLEHISEEHCMDFIKNLCSHSNDILLSTTPEDFSEPTHINVQQTEYWAKRFAFYHFYRDQIFDASFISSHAVRFLHRNVTLPLLAEEYERNLRIQKKKFFDLEKEIKDLENLLSEEREQRIAVEEKNTKLIMKNVSMSDEIVYDEKHIEDLQKENFELHQNLEIIMGEIQTILGSNTWKMTKPVRAFLNVLKKLLKSNPITRNICKIFLSLKHYGFKTTIRKIRFRISYRHGSKANAKRTTLTEAEKLRQSRRVFPRKIKFSILVPLYNTPEKYLIEMINSVLDQTYQNWELCLVDGSDQEHAYVGKIVKGYVEKDSRIRYRLLDENLGISGNTNQCIEMATGDYIALFDHDDLLHPAALYENMIAITEQCADFIYTDENTFHDTPKDAYCPHFKPDFAPDNLRANNYICHFSVFSRSLLDQVGGFRDEYNGSQDYDIILRLTEKAKKIVHIPKILYYWRAHKNSVAADISAKPYTIVAAKKAINAHLQRVGLEGEAVDSSVISTYKINYKIKGEPLISILIPNKDHVSDLNKCIMSILEKSTYKNYEIIIIENNSKEYKTFEYYKSLEVNKKIKRINWEGVFNYSAINNFGYQHADGEYILLLNNDVEIITPNWLEEMLMYAQRPDVGAVGVKLYYPDDTIQHAGIGMGLLTLAGHYHRNFPRSHPGYMGRLSYAQNVSAVTAACMMIPRHVYEEVHGLDESFEVAFNDVDLCMRIRKNGYLIVFTPYAELYHYESKSRGNDDTRKKRQRFVSEVTRFQERWKAELEKGDPYYNPNFSLDREDFTIL